jgi:methylmalonyl-CoA epimerase
MTVSITHDHVGIAVTPADLDATIDWYATTLGFTVEQRFDSHGTTFVFITHGDARIELVAGASDRNDAPADNILTSMNPSRLHHFCLAVDDLDAAVAQVRERGAELIGGPMDVADIGRRIAFVTDNVGTIIELSARCGPGGSIK